MLTKCIGGVLDGQHVKCREPFYRGDAPVPDLGVGIFGSFSLGPDGPDSMATSTPTMYRLRTVHCDGEQILFYAPDDWTDLEALREALG